MMKTMLTTTAMIAGLTLMVANNAEAAMKKSVSFESNGQTLAGDLYLPDDYRQGDKIPGIVVTGSWTSVKEQMAGGYAERMADRGYAALAFDFRGWGKSASGLTGILKFVEDPKAKTEDIIAAADYLATRDEVDSSRIATLGVCASAGYATDAALRSDTIKATAVVAPWYHDKGIVAEVYGDYVQPFLKASREAAEKYRQTGEMTLMTAAGKSGEENVLMPDADYYNNPERGAIPEYDNKFNVMSWEPWLEYDAIQTASRLSKPILVVHSEAAAIPQGAKKYLEQSGDNASQLWFDDVTQFDFYDDPAVMAKASDAVAGHFDKNL